MVPMRMTRMLAFGGTLAACLSVCAPTASAGSPPAAQNNDVFEQKTNTSAQNNDQWVSYGKAPTLEY